MTMGASQGSSLELAQAYIATLSILVNVRMCMCMCMCVCVCMCMCCNTVSSVQARAGGVTSEVIKHALSRRHRLHVQWQATHLGITLQTEGGPAAIIKDVQSKLAPHERTRSMPGTQLNPSQAELVVDMVASHWYMVNLLALL